MSLRETSLILWSGPDYSWSKKTIKLIYKFRTQLFVDRTLVLGCCINFDLTIERLKAYRFLILAGHMIVP
jgi:hypothetical protein